MRNLVAVILASLVVASTSLFAQESKPSDSRSQQGARVESQEKGASWTRALMDRAKRGTMHDAFQMVRGDSGKWNDAPIFQHAPPIGHKPAKVSLDDWADQLLDNQSFQLTTDDDNWLLLRTRQLDDNDRVWVERIERRGNQIMIVVNQAIWQGRYSKTFTYYGVFGVNLGKLEPGTYEARWITKPLAFKQFEGDGRPIDNWPKDDHSADKQPSELRVAFSVVAKIAASE